MRKLLLIMALVLLMPAVLAFEAKDIAKGSSPIVNDAHVVFLTFEDDVDEDLNDDGDVSDKIVQYYNIDTRKTRSTKTEAVNYALFEDRLIIEDERHKIALFDLRDHSTKALDLFGRSPSICSNIIAYEAYEDDINQDLNNDNDEDDFFIGYYDLVKEDAERLEQGKKPIVLKDKILFSADEGELQEDLNSDGDLDDVFVQYYDFVREKVKTTIAQGEVISASEDTAVLAQKDKLFLLDLSTGKTKEIGKGNFASAYEQNVVFEDNGKLFCYNELNKTVEITEGKSPSIFDDFLVFASGKNIMLSKEEYCEAPAEEETEAEDAEADETGPEEGSEAEELEQQEAEQAEQITAQQTSPPNDDKPIVTGSAVEEQARKDLPDQLPEQDDDGVAYWFLVAVGMTSVAIIVYFVFPRYVKKKKKGFGF